MHEGMFQRSPRHQRFSVVASKRSILQSMEVTCIHLPVGILSRNIESDEKDLASLNIEKIDIVVCNLYPFKQTIIKPDVTMEQAVEEIDIGGVALLRAAAKNHIRVAIATDPNDYNLVLAELRNCGCDMTKFSSDLRNSLAVKVLEMD